jgi:hypothetical protein
MLARDADGAPYASAKEYAAAWGDLEPVGQKLKEHPGSIPLFADYTVSVADLLATGHDSQRSAKMLTPCFADRCDPPGVPRVAFIVVPGPNDLRGTAYLHLREAVFFERLYDGNAFGYGRHVRFAGAAQGELVARYYDSACGGSYLQWIARDVPLAQGECWAEVVDRHTPAF